MTSVEGSVAKRVPVLMYHRVELLVQSHELAYAVSTTRFEAQLDWLAAHGWQACSMRDFHAWYTGRGTLPPNSVLITFDDGFASLYKHAFPLLRTRGWPATVFLVSGLIGAHDTWVPGRGGARASHPLLGPAQIAEMARGGFEFHSHSSGHADLTRLDDNELQAQVEGSRRQLQDLLGTAVDHFAYPFGRHDGRVRRAVEAAGYQLAFGVDPGFNRPGQERLTVRRLDITGHDTAECFGRKLQLGSNDGSLKAYWRYLASRMRARLATRSSH